jgi:hypothetical protein
MKRSKIMYVCDVGATLVVTERSRSVGLLIGNDKYYIC